MIVWWPTTYKFKVNSEGAELVHGAARTQITDFLGFEGPGWTCGDPAVDCLHDGLTSSVGGEAVHGAAMMQTLDSFILPEEM